MNINTRKLISEVKTLSSGTVLSIARNEGMLSNRANWLEAESIVEEWLEFIEESNDSSENWKQSWKKFAKHKDDLLEAWLNDEEEVMEEKEMKEIKIERIIETTYENNTCWVEYKVNGKYGYEITEEYSEGEEEELKNDIEHCQEGTKEGMIKKPDVKKCSPYLAEIIEQCRESENEMWFVEYEDLKELFIENGIINYAKEGIEQLLIMLQKEVEELKIEDYIIFGEDDCAITVYGGVITKFLF